ncbi:hypothetical protein [Candidatus Nitrospira bockiana]
MRIPLWALVIVALLPIEITPADGLVRAETRQVAGGQGRSMAPERGPVPAEAEAPPSRMDPGMQHRQEGDADPRASVAPPNRDPSISSNPDAPPAGAGTRDMPRAPQAGREGSQ